MPIFKNSVHLENFPDLHNFPIHGDLVNQMDIVRNICSTALSIRDDYKIRVRLPLSKMKIICEKISSVRDFKDLIMDEVNVKEIEFVDDIQNFSEPKLQINFKVAANRLKSKTKDVLENAKIGNWKLCDDGTISVANEILKKEEFSIQFTPKNIEDGFIAKVITGISGLVCLDITITKELENEGISRDLIRMIQQKRKDLDLDISDKIVLVIDCDDEMKELVMKFEKYIMEQTLSIRIEYRNLDLEEEKVGNCKVKLQIEKCKIY